MSSSLRNAASANSFVTIGMVVVVVAILTIVLDVAVGVVNAVLTAAVIGSVFLLLFAVVLLALCSRRAVLASTFFSDVRAAKGQPTDVRLQPAKPQAVPGEASLAPTLIN